MLKRVSLILFAAGLSACGSSSGTGPFGRPDIKPPAFSATAGNLAIAGGGGIRFSNRIDPKDGNLYDAEVLPGTPAPVPAPTSGSARMTGPFALRHVTDLRVTDKTYSGKVKDVTGSITLNADFGAGTLRGAGDGLTVDGRLKGDTLSGTASYGGVRGNLDGFAGATNAIGIFEGKAPDSSIAGGFVVAK